MEHPKSDEPVVQERCATWALQEVVTLKQKIHDVESSIVYFVPKNKNEMPMIGYLTCSCESKKMTHDPEHKKAIACLFMRVLERLHSLGFTRVRLTAKLLQRPECLMSFMSDPANVSIICQDGAEVTMSTRKGPE
jgi:hypothetical protein